MMHVYNYKYWCFLQADIQKIPNNTVVWNDGLWQFWKCVDYLRQDKMSESYQWLTPSLMKAWQSRFENRQTQKCMKRWIPSLVDLPLTLIKRKTTVGVLPLSKTNTYLITEKPMQLLHHYWLLDKILFLFLRVLFHSAQQHR